MPSEYGLGFRKVEKPIENFKSFRTVDVVVSKYIASLGHKRFSTNQIKLSIRQCKINGSHQVCKSIDVHHRL